MSPYHRSISLFFILSLLLFKDNVLFEISSSSCAENKIDVIVEVPQGDWRDCLCLQLLSNPLVFNTIIYCSIIFHLSLSFNKEFQNRYYYSFNSNYTNTVQIIFLRRHLIATSAWQSKSLESSELPK